MMVASTAGHSGEKEKEKVEKRRALGRGLESLLPGPRVVAAAPHQAAPHPTASTGETITIQGVVEEISASQSSSLSSSSPLLAKDARNGAPAVSSLAAATELGSAGQPGAAVARFTGGPGAIAESEAVTILAQADSRVPGTLITNIDPDAI